jgi:hypothetical protein
MATTRSASLSPEARYRSIIDSWLFYDGDAYGAITRQDSHGVAYSKSSAKKLCDAHCTPFHALSFTIPGEDFIKPSRSLRQGLRWYFRSPSQALKCWTTKSSMRIPTLWSGTSPKLPEGAGHYRTYVTVQRKDDFVFPVDVKVTLMTTALTEHWDGRDRWVRYVYDRKSQVLSAEIDPDHQVWLDRGLFNNSYTVKADSRATKKLSNILGFVSEWMAQLLAWLA